MLRFSQYDQAPIGGAGGRVYRALEGEGAFSVLGPDVPAPEGHFASYRCAPLGDTGLAPEMHRILMIVAFNCPEARIPELERWYAEEHIRMLRKADGWLRAVHCRVRGMTGSPPWTHIAFHELRDLAVMDSPERAAARDTPWRDRLAAEPWFPLAGRWVYAPI